MASGVEEILILLKTQKEIAKVVAERIRNEIARDPIPYKNDILVSIIGIFSCPGIHEPFEFSFQAQSVI